jgi:NAD(P)-dependent dehydrogenase (short-subunit alcohol dehydrogenase family)
MRSTPASTWRAARKASAPLSSSLFRLDGQVAVVTGASSGLGQAAARALAGAGATVAVVARRRERVEALATEIGGHAIAADLTDDSQVAAIIPNVASVTAPPTILVNAAGHYVSRSEARDEQPDAIRATLGLNLIAPFLLAQHAFPHMAGAGRGSVINISSISGLVGIPGIPQASYAASKAGLSGLTVELAVQWARHGIRVNTIAPGFFRSEITAELYDQERSAAWLRRNTPLPVTGTPQDFAGAVLWLASDAGRYVTGQTIVIDGGWTAR